VKATHRVLSLADGADHHSLTNGPRVSISDARNRGPAGQSRRPPKIAMLLAQQIVGEITDRNLEPGAPLLSEKEMLDQYGVARGTLREALRFLEMQGVLAIKTGPGGGPVVSPISSRPLASLIALLLQLNRTPFRDVLEARMVLEPALAAKAATRIDDASLEALHESIRHMREHIDDLSTFLDENDNFHGLVVRAAHSEVLALCVSSLSWITDGTPLGVDYSMEVREAVAKEHQRIYRALQARDAARAETAMASHLGDFAAYLEKRYPAILDVPLRWDHIQW
jgi:DNA-binding FadR family transcriptional regulator